MQSLFQGRGGISAQAEVVYMIYLYVYLYRWRKDWEQQPFSDGGQNEKAFLALNAIASQEMSKQKYPQASSAAQRASHFHYKCLQVR